jgi:hypothetical protein
MTVARGDGEEEAGRPRAAATRDTTKDPPPRSLVMMPAAPLLGMTKRAELVAVVG